MEPDWVWPIRRTSAEHALLRPRAIAPGMDDQHVAGGAIEPGKQEDVVADLQASKTLGEPRLEDQPGVWCALVSLPWCAGTIDERGFDPPDRLQLISRSIQGAPCSSRITTSDSRAHRREHRGDVPIADRLGGEVERTAFVHLASGPEKRPVSRRAPARSPR